MELFGILFSLPAAFISSVAYRALLLAIVGKVPWIGAVFRPASIAVLTMVAVELILVLSLGAVRLGTLVGPQFEGLHFAIFLLGTPALANLLVLRGRSHRPFGWGIVGSLCMLLALILVIMQYDVFESLHGVDGMR